MDTKFNAELLSLDKVELREFSIQLQGKSNLSEEEKPFIIELTNKSYSGLNITKNRIAFGLVLNAKCGDGKDSPKFHFDLLFHFQYEELSLFIEEDNTDDNAYKIDGAIGAVLAAISYSTARGIVLEKTAGTLFEGFILPIINPNDLIES